MDELVEEQIRVAIASVDERFKKVFDEEENNNLAYEARSKIPKGFSIQSPLEIKRKPDCFHAVFSFNEFDASNVKKIVDAYSLLNNETLRITSTRFCPKSGTLVEKSFCCQHNTRYKPTKDLKKKILKANPSMQLSNYLKRPRIP